MENLFKNKEKVSLNGIKTYPFESQEELLWYIKNKSCILIAINAGKILYSSEIVRNIINNNIGYCDGISAVAALKKKGFKNVIQIPGCELWLKIVEDHYKTGSFYLVGGTTEVIEATVHKLKTEYSDIKIVGYRNGYIKTDEEKDNLIKDIVSKKPTIVFVAMGSPRQEILMQEMIGYHKALYQGLGGSFDVYIGKVKRAPKWWRDHKLEGPYRVFSGFSKARWKRFYKDMFFWWKLYTKQI